MTADERLGRPTTPGSAAGAPTSEPPAVDRRWVIAFVLAMVGIAAGWFGPIQILLPAQAARIAGADGKEHLLALVTGYGAIASMIGNPLWGALSDRLRTPWGRRRPVFVLGTVVGVTGLLGLAAAETPGTMLAGWVAVQIGLNGPMAALAAIIADRVPERQRGTVGAWFGIAQTLGVVAGTAVAVIAGEGPLGYVAVAVAVPALGIALLLAHREAPTTVRGRLPGPGPEHPGTGATLEAPDAGPAWRTLRPTLAFTWVWSLRLLLNLVNALVLLYLYYYLEDAVGITEPGTWVLGLTALTALVTVGVAGVGGVLSDRWGRRRVFIAAAAVLLAAASVLLAAAPVIPAVLVATVLLGSGWGLYVAVDLAVLTAVLPDPSTRATMLGFGNVAAALPQVLAPVIAAPLVTSSGGYPLMYGLAAGLCLVALLGVRLLRDVP
jgi:MFS family permease